MTTADKILRPVKWALIAATFAALMFWVLPAAAVERGDKVTVNQTFVCSGQVRKSWEGTVTSTRGPFAYVRPSDRSWCRVPSIRVWTQRVKPMAARDCP